MRRNQNRSNRRPQNGQSRSRGRSQGRQQSWKGGNLRKRVPQQGGQKGRNQSNGGRNQNKGAALPKKTPLSQMRSVFNPRDVIKDPIELLGKFRKEELVKIKESAVPFDSTITLRDIVLKIRGPQEDALFLKHKGLFLNLRRGNTLIEVKNESEGDKTSNSHYIGRRGLRKFFDLFPEYIDFAQKKRPNFDGIGIKTAGDHSLVFNMIFKDIENFYTNKLGQIVIYQTMKANGENCQISWFEDKQSWVISSKNVSILARTREDIALYTERKFQFSILIANSWFDLVEAMTPEVLALTQTRLADHTLVGEYTGNPECQHLVRYDKIQLIFYSVVSNNGSLDALPFKEGVQIINELGLTLVGYKEYPGVSSVDALCDQMRQLISDVETASLEDQQEGSVLYITKRYNNDSESFISCCKLKTIEYRIYRKLREDLKVFINKKNVVRSELFEKFSEKVKALMGENTLPKTFEEYIKVGQLAFDFVEKYPNDSFQVHKAYVNFLCIVEYCLANEKEIHPGYFNDDVIKGLIANSWKDYATSKTIQEPTTTKAQIHRQRLVVLIPISVPGIGKSHLYKNVISSQAEELGYEARCVSSDAARKEQMDMLSRGHPLYTDKELFNKTRAAGNAAFDRIMADSIKKSSGSKDILVFIDKNHPPNAIKKTIAAVRKLAPKNLDLRILAVLPQTTAETIEVQNKKDGISSKQECIFPFSIEHWVQCLIAVQLRKDHPTLNGDSTTSCSIMMMFYTLFRDFKFDGDTLMGLGFHGALSMPFFKEGALALPEELTEVTRDLISTLRVGEKSKDIESLEKILTKVQEIIMSTEGTRASLQEQAEKFNNCIANLPDQPPKLPEPEAKTAKGKEAAGAASKQTSGAIQSTKYPLKAYFEEVLQNNTVLKAGLETNPAEIVKSKKAFKPKKIPIALGIFLQEAEDSKARIQGLLKFVTGTIATEYHDSTAETDLTDFQGEMAAWKWPNSHHIMTYFVGMKKANTTNPIYKAFETDKHYPFSFKHVVYIPGKMAAALVYLDKEKIQVDSEFPYMTLALGEASASFASEVLTTIFGGYLRAKYDTGLQLGANQHFKLSVNLAGNTEDVYLLELPQEVFFGATTQASASK